MSTAWTRLLGSTQGRIAPVGWAAPAGTYVLCLGSDLPGQWERLAVGDGVAIAQTGSFPASSLLRATAAVRPPVTAPPAGTWWEARTLVDGVVVWSHIITRTRVLDDLGVDLAPLAGDHAIAFALVLAGAAGEHEVELPAFYIDALAYETGGRLALMNRDPADGEPGVTFDTPIAVDIVDAGAAAITLSTIRVYVNGVLALTGPGTFGALFTGSVTSLSASHVRLVVDPVDTFDSLAVVTVRVVAETADAATIDETYVFEAEDLEGPLVTAALATTEHTVRLTFDAPVDMATATDPGLYALTRELGAVAVLPIVTGAAEVSATAVDLTLDIPMTPRALYRVVLDGVLDLSLNAAPLLAEGFPFWGFAPPVPEGRSFSLWRMLPEKNRSEDASGDLAKFIAIFQELVDLELYDIDRFTTIIDVDIADEAFLDAMLDDLGNPFDFALTVADKRRLLLVLVAIYKQKGTDIGILNAVRFFLGLDGLTVVAGGRGSAVLGEWVLDEGELGGSDRDLYSFDVHAPMALTAEQRDRITRIAEYMKPAWTHFVRLVEPSTPTPIDHVELGLSELGSDGTDGDFLLH